MSAVRIKRSSPPSYCLFSDTTELLTSRSADRDGGHASQSEMTRPALATHGVVMSLDDFWEGPTDPAARRRRQNRVNQRAHSMFSETQANCA